MIHLEQTYTQANPNSIYRSKLFSLSTSIIFACDLAYTLKYAWSLNKLDVNSNQIIDLSYNPTVNLAELVIQANTLTFGLYQFKFHVNITNLVLSNSVETFIKIVPTGLNVYAIQNGIQSQLIGYNQEFTLNPAKYSVDLDNLLSPKSLSFEFYCRTINLNTNTKSNANQISLQMYKNIFGLQMKWNETCFASNSNI